MSRGAQTHPTQSAGLFRTEFLFPPFLRWCNDKRIHLPMQMSEMWVRPLGGEDPLEETATHSSILVWSIPWTEKPDGLQSMELQRVRQD